MDFAIRRERSERLESERTSKIRSLFTTERLSRTAPKSLFLRGDFHDHNFKDFELTVDVMTKPDSNGGIYIQTEYQDQGWPR